MISAYDGEVERKRAAADGAIDFIGKPLKRVLIVDSLNKYFPTFLIKFKLPLIYGKENLNFR
jgi:response regulator RpfG family c-di-GMP phosphodiesterase